MAKTSNPTPARPKTPVLDAMIEEARRTPKETDITHEELGRRLGITEEDQQVAQATLDRWLQEDAEGETNVDKAHRWAIVSRAALSEASFGQIRVSAAIAKRL